MTTNFAISALLTVYHISRLDTMCFVPQSVCREFLL